MPLLNYTTSVPADRSVSQIVDTLRLKGAQDIMLTYDNQHNLSGLAFRIETDMGLLAFRLPAHVEGIRARIQKEYRQDRDHPQRRRGQVSYRFTPRMLDSEHCRNVAWRVLKDWIEAQLAIIEAGLARMEEVFLPYALVGNTEQTLSDHMLAGGLKALMPPKDGGTS